HLTAGLPVTANAVAAQTIHNRPERVAALGIAIEQDCPLGAHEVVLGDVDLESLTDALAAFGLSLPSRFAFAVQDHGVASGRGNNDVRGDYLQWLVTRGRTLAATAFLKPPAEMTRMWAIADQIPGAVIMDTGAAALLGAMHDPVVANAAAQGAILVNIGNMHTFAALMFRDRVLGVLEHHSRGMTLELLAALVRHLQDRDLTNAQFREWFDGHGIVLADDIDPDMTFEFVAITGPNRGLARGTDWYFAAPHGDMMLTGSFGLVSGYLAATGGM
ncbi:MAG TPA: DUF1786 family protein, partial [Thermomicrobiales bacterium]|nr:DUF1786 family protein [Thermomicrobiales bacterium]